MLGLSGGFLALVVATMATLVLLAVIGWVVWFIAAETYWLPRA